jgi:hypothetical protein
MFRQRGVLVVLLYIDDFFIAGSTFAACASALQIVLDLFAELGVEASPEKTEGPAQVLTFLGIQFDFVSRRLR